ncbi:MAG: class I SAM-dependent methyltransferase [Cyanosarcina radialis HA8281-LM2]|nr:class I SAM-dependent methyltransferase [Cyanosarcina radialis HA8281-LM2]
MNLEEVRNTFERQAFNYDRLIPKLIPYYREQHTLLLELIPFDKGDRFKALDLGCGTGILSHLILQNFPQATVVSFDLAENMLAVCQKNLLAYEERSLLKLGNFATDDLGSGYDLVISGLAIHHLDNDAKQNLFKRLFSAMNSGGLLLIRDVVTGATTKLTKQYEQLWRDYIKSNGEDDRHWFQKYLEEDIPSSVEDQIQWLKKAGFTEVGCHWRYFNFAIFGGMKG